MLVEPPGDFLVGRVETQREVSSEHRGCVASGSIVRVRHCAGPCPALRGPLVCASRALSQLPLVAEEIAEELVAPLRRSRRPGDLQAAGDCVASVTFAVPRVPTEPLLLNRAPLRLRTYQGGIPRTVGFTEAVAAGDQGNGFFVIHCHTGKRFANVPGCGEGIRLAARTFRVDVDETHLYGAQWALQVALPGVALIRQPLALWTPVDLLLRLPDVLPATRKAEGFEAHRLEGYVASENHQVAPGNFATVLLLDRPEQPARLVEVRIVRPTVERCESLLTGTGTTATIRDTVCTGTV